MMDSCSRLDARKFLAGGLPHIRGGRIVESDLQQCSLSGERGTQLVRGVGDEMSLRRKGRLEALKKTVEGVTQLLELSSAASSASLSCRLVAEIRRAVAVMVRPDAAPGQPRSSRVRPPRRP